MSSTDDNSTKQPDLDDLLDVAGTGASGRVELGEPEKRKGPALPSELEALVDGLEPTVADQIAELIRRHPQRLQRIMSGFVEGQEGWPRWTGEPRKPLGDEEEPTWEGGSSVEGVGNPSPTAAHRLRLADGDEEIEHDTPSTLESLGEPSTRADQRVPLDAEEEPTWVGASPLETLGSTSADARERFGAEERRVDKVRRSSANAAGRGLLAALMRRALRQGVSPDELLRSLEDLGTPEEESRHRIQQALDEVAFETRPRRPQAAFESERRDDRVSIGHRPQPTPGGRSNALSGDLGTSTDAQERVRRHEPRPAGGPQAAGLDAVFAVPILEGVRGNYRREEVEQDNAVDRPGLDPVPPTRIRLMGQLSAAQTAVYGDDPRWTRPQLQEVLEFVHHRFELLTVERPCCTTWSEPGAAPAVGELPRFAAGELPFGNGLLAFLLESRYAHDLNADGQLRLVGAVWRTWSHKRLRESTAQAFALVEPVLDEVWAQLCKAKKGVKVDADNLAALHLGTKRSQKGRVQGAGNADHVLLWFKRPTDPDRFGELSSPEDGLEDPSQIFGRMQQWNRAGLWTNVRRRFIGALPYNPEETGRVLMHLQRVHRASVMDPGGHKEHLARLHTHLEALQAEAPEQPTPFSQAVSYALGLWSRLADDSSEALRKPQAWRAESMPWVMDDQEAPPEEHMGWVSLVHGVHRLGGRPWTYLRDLLDAVTADAPFEPQHWTPHAWVQRQR